MKRRDIIRRAGRSLRQAKIRTLLTALAISVGAFTVTLALAAGAGGKAYTDNLIKTNGDMQTLSVFAKVDKSNDAPQEYTSESTPTTQGTLGDHDIAIIKKIDGVESVTPMYNISASYVTREGQKKYQTNLSIKADRTTIPLTAGSLDDNQVPVGSIVLPESYVGPLGFTSAQDAIGKQVTVRIDQPVLPGQPLVGKDWQFTVAAVDKKSSTILSYQTAIRVSPTDGKAIYDFQSDGARMAAEYYGVDVRVADGADVKKVQTAIQDAGYTVFSQQDVQTALFTFINVVQYGAAGFGGLAILASIFGIINTQYISVLERTQQIGLMKALGARRKDVARLFRYEAAWVGFLGGLLGTILAWAMGAFNPWIAKVLQLESGTQLLKFDPITSVILILALMFVAVVAGYFPARKAAKLDPIEALRTE